MPEIQVKMINRLGSLGDQDKMPETVMQIDILPRGSGNRNLARRLAEAFESHDLMGDHVTEVRAGASRVTVHIKPSLAAISAVMECMKRERQRVAEEKAAVGVAGGELEIKIALADAPDARNGRHRIGLRGELAPEFLAQRRAVEEDSRVIVLRFHPAG